MVFITVDAQSKIPCVSFSGTDSGVLLNLVSSHNLDRVVIRLVCVLVEFMSQDTRYRHEVENS